MPIAKAASEDAASIAADLQPFASSHPHVAQARRRGIVTCAGNIKYNICAWVLIRMLRHLGCTLPIQVWYLGQAEYDEAWFRLVRDFDVECVDAHEVREQHPHPELGGWQLKPYAIQHSPFQEVLFLDADNLPLVKPEFLFDTPQFRSTGALFWPDGIRTTPQSPSWRAFDVPYRDESEFETGQILIDKPRCGEALKLCNWYNERSSHYYKFVYGDKDTFRFAWHRTKTPFAMPERPMHLLRDTLCQNDFDGRRIFQHRSRAKWSLHVVRHEPGFEQEALCFEFLDELRRQWDPLKKFRDQLSPGDFADISAHTGTRFRLLRQERRCGRVTFSPDWTLIHGSRFLEDNWWLRGSQQVLRLDDGNAEYQLNQKLDGVWASRSAPEKRSDIQLIPV